LIPKTPSETERLQTKTEKELAKDRDGELDLDENDVRTDINVVENEINTDNDEEQARIDERARNEELERLAEEERQLEEEKRLDEQQRGEDDATEVPTEKITQPTTVSTTTTKATRRPRPPSPDNQPLPTCALPIVPNYDVDFDAGFRFGRFSTKICTDYLFYNFLCLLF
jgi:hypothetical protein